MQSNEKRKQFEDYLNKVPSTDFMKGIEYFISGMELENPELSQLSAVYLCKKYFDDSDNLQKMTNEVRQAIVSKVFTMF